VCGTEHDNVFIVGSTTCLLYNAASHSQEPVSSSSCVWSASCGGCQSAQHRQPFQGHSIRRKFLVCLQERASWRVRVVGLSMGGEGPEEVAPTVSNLLAYDGEHHHCRPNHYRACIVSQAMQACICITSNAQRTLWHTQALHNAAETVLCRGQCH
jgi:hypothetical protein